MSTFLVIHLIIAWGAVAVRIDRFPITWAPMYAIRPKKPAKPPVAEVAIGEVARERTDFPDTLSQEPEANAKAILRRVSVEDKKRLNKKGWVATRRDGSTLNIGPRDINVPRRSMRRLYYDRTFGKAPFNYKQRNYDAGNWDRWLWGLEPGEDYITHDWRRRLLVSVNKTYGLHPEDPDFIVSLEAYHDTKIVYNDGSVSIEERSKVGTAQWHDAWSEDSW